MIKVAVGSKNPVKIAATQQAFALALPELSCTFTGHEVTSGVSAQPMHDQETIQGARTRAHRALAEAKADFGVGLESGLHQLGDHWFDTCWVVVVTKDGTEGIGSSLRLRIPEKIMGLIKPGTELGHACDAVFNKTNVGKAEGFYGLMTNNILTRTTSTRDAVICALTHFLHPHLTTKS